MKELNGFKIDKYNQYNLDEGAKRSTCPLCSKDRKNYKETCASLHWDTGLGICYHCGEIFQLHTYKKTNNSKKQFARPIWKNNVNIDDRIVKWFETERSISQATLKIAKITSSTESFFDKDANGFVNRVAINFNYFRYTELINVKYRDSKKNFKLFKDAELSMYNIDNCHISESIIICEGEIDVLSFIESGILHATSVPNGSTLKNTNLSYIDNCIEFFENKKKIYLALDNDEAGIQTTKELIRRFGAERCLIVSFDDCKDANEYLKKYGKDALVSVINNATEAPIHGVSSILDWNNEFDDYVQNGMKKGFVTGIKSLDNIFSTYTGQYIVVTGKPSSGKSDFVDQMCIGYNKMYGWKTAYASPENMPYKIHAGKIMSKLCGKWINKLEYIGQSWYESAKEYINDNFKFISLDRFDLDTVLETARIMILKYGIKILVIDPFNKVKLTTSSESDINVYTNNYLLKIDDFCRKYDVLAFLIAHPRKPSVNDSKTYKPTFYDIKGGGEFYDMSPHGLLVDRNYDYNLTEITTLKVKFAHLGENNKSIFLKWSNKNGRFLDFEDQRFTAELMTSPIDDDSNWLIKIAKDQSITFKEDNVFNKLPNGDLPF